MARDDVILWLQGNQASIVGNIEIDALGGRTLGPPSGNINDPYPFQQWNPFCSLIADFAVNNVPADTACVSLLSFSYKGFVAYQSYPWQTMTADDWLPISLNQPAGGGPALSLTIAIDENVLELSAASSVSLSPLYKLHRFETSLGGKAIFVDVITFEKTSEDTAPFLRPHTVTADAAAFDARCIHFRAKAQKLFSDTTILKAGKNVDLGVSGNRITISKTDLISGEGALRTISGQSANEYTHNFTLNTTGCHRFAQWYDEVDPANKTLTLLQGSIHVSNLCKACCDCSQYVEHYETLRTLFEEQTLLINQYNDFQSKYLVVLEAYNKLLNKDVSV
jgi:hypothetical protein